MSERAKKAVWPGGSKAVFKASKRKDGESLRSAMALMAHGSAYYPEHVYQAMYSAAVAVSKLQAELRRWR